VTRKGNTRSEPPLFEDVGTRLRRARGRHNLTVAEAAAKLGVSWSQYWEAEGNEGLASLPQGLLEKAAALYGVPLYWLQTGNGPPVAAAREGGGA
jgi:transcriptional regulator with XRE-family HTH domain